MTKKQFKKQLKKRLAAYEHTLAVIWKLNGRYRRAVTGHENRAYGEDPQYLAAIALARGNEKLYKELSLINSASLTVSRKGRLKPVKGYQDA